MSHREKLLLETERLLSLQGFHGTGINEILRNTKVPKGSLYYHFPDGKKQIVLEALKTSTIKLSLTYKKLLREVTSEQEGVNEIVAHSIQFLNDNDFRATSIITLVAQNIISLSKDMQENCKQLFELIIGSFESFYLKLEDENWSEKARSLFTQLQGATLLCIAYRETSFLEALKK